MPAQLVVSFIELSSVSSWAIYVQHM